MTLELCKATKKVRILVRRPAKRCTSIRATDWAESFLDYSARIPDSGVQRDGRKENTAMRLVYRAWPEGLQQLDTIQPVMYTST